MTQNQPKLPEAMKNMADRVIKDPDAAPSSEAIHVALMFAQIAWNEAAGLDHFRGGYRSTWELIEAENPDLWSEFKTHEIDALIDELVQYKKEHFPADQRQILICGMVDDKVRVEWLPPVASGTDSKAEMRLYGLVSVDRERATQFLQDSKGLSEQEAAKEVGRIAQELGLG